jgi:hypothetical protein
MSCPLTPGTRKLFPLEVYVVTPRENLEYLIGVRDKAKLGAGPAATAMARHVAEYVANVTLRESSHPDGMWYRAGPGRPPAYASGNLSRSMYWTTAHTGLRTSAYVGNKADYSRILEFGCVIQPASKKFLHWTDTGGSWYHTFLVMPAHPFVEPGTDDTIRDGSLQSAAVEGFIPYDP